MLLSKTCVYGIRATLYLASVEGENYVSIKSISSKLDISFHFLTKILQMLTSAEIMESFRGPRGGVRLIGNPNEVTLMDIVAAIDGKDLFIECALGLPGCGVAQPCPLHDKWARTRDRIRFLLESTSLIELSKLAVEKNLRLSHEVGINQILGLVD